jgi:hypothetical protein
MKVRRNGERWPPGRDDMSARGMRWGAGIGFGISRGEPQIAQISQKGECAGTPRGAHTALQPSPCPLPSDGRGGARNAITKITKRSHSGLRPLRRVAGNDRNMGESDWIRPLNFLCETKPKSGLAGGQMMKNYETNPFARNPRFGTRWRSEIRVASETLQP